MPDTAGWKQEIRNPENDASWNLPCALLHSREMTEPDDFEKAAREKSPGLWSEVAHLLRHNKKWWLIPILVMLLTIGALVVFSAGSPAVQFIYTLF